MPKLTNKRLEAFALCLCAGTDPHICYFGVGYGDNVDKAVLLANTPVVRERTRELYLDTWQINRDDEWIRENFRYEKQWNW